MSVTMSSHPKLFISSTYYRETFEREGKREKKNGNNEVDACMKNWQENNLILISMCVCV